VAVLRIIDRCERWIDRRIEDHIKYQPTNKEESP
jgi:hypothetical protein